MEEAKLNEVNGVVADLDNMFGHTGKHRVSNEQAADFGRIVTEILAKQFDVEMEYVGKLKAVLAVSNDKKYGEHSGRYIVFPSMHGEINPFRFLNVYERYLDHVYKHEREFYTDASREAVNLDQAHKNDQMMLADVRRTIAPLANFEF